MSKKERVRKFGEVFTPEHIVKQMCDTLEQENPEQDVFAPWTTFLEPTCGDGAFILEILKRKFQRCKCRADYMTAIESVYGLEIQADNVAECIRRVTELCEGYFHPTPKELQVIEDHYIVADSLKIMRMMSDERLYVRVAQADAEQQAAAAGADDVPAVDGDAGQ